MKFWDREKEKEWLKRYLKSEPNAILFVYGPKSSGKSTLLNRVVEELSKDEFVYYWYDLREKVIANYKNVLEIFFKEKGWLKEFITAVMPKINIGVFEVEPQRLEKVLSGKLDAFEEMRKELEKVKRTGKKPVIVFDELQKLKDVYMNGNGDGQKSQRPLVKELFNFFVRLTKVLHLSHVIVMSSDTFFIEEVYSNSVLSNTSEFYLVDFFDDKTAIKILIEEGIDERVAKEVISRIGGVPWMMERVLSNGNLFEKLESLYIATKGIIREALGDIYDENEELYKNVVNVLKKAINGKRLSIPGKDRKFLKVLVEREILFYDPIKGEIRFQTKLHERAAKELLKECIPQLQ